MITGKSVTLLDRKLDACFDHLDPNRDGEFDHTDSLALAARIIAYLGEPFGSDKSRALLVELDTFWTHLAPILDTNQDGTVSRPQWREGLKKAYVDDPSGVNEGFHPLAEAIWQLCDRDGDGRVEAAEFADFHRAFGT